MSKIPVIIDCDPGHDDVVAIILALAHEELDVKGIVTVAGNNTLDNVTTNALKALELIGRTDIPVVRGSKKPMRKEHQSAAGHGVTGLDGPELPEPTTKTLDVNFVDFYHKLLTESDEKVTILALGPLTNLATLFFCHPELVEKVEAINLMGGANLSTEEKPFHTFTRTAEFNIWQDAESASAVFDLPVRIVMFGLDLTCAYGATRETVEKFRTEGGRVGKTVAELLDFYGKSSLNSELARVPIHDACPVAYTFCPELFEVEKHDITVDYGGEHTYGATYVNMRTHRGEPTKDTYWAKSVEYDRFMDMILEACKKFS